MCERINSQIFFLRTIIDYAVHDLTVFNISKGGWKTATDGQQLYNAWMQADWVLTYYGRD